MNILAKKQFKENCKDFEIVKEFFEGEQYLDSLSDLMYNDLSKEDRVKVDDMIEEMIFTLEVIYNVIIGDYYLSKWFKKIGIIFTKRYGEEFRMNLSKHYDNMLKYADYFDNSFMICERPKEDLNMYDLMVAYDLTYLSFITIINDTAEADLKLLNKNKYCDSDIKDFNEVKKTINACVQTLKYKNRQFKKNKNEEN